MNSKSRAQRHIHGGRELSEEICLRIRKRTRPEHPKSQIPDPTVLTIQRCLDEQKSIPARQIDGLIVFRERGPLSRETPVVLIHIPERNIQ